MRKMTSAAVERIKPTDKRREIPDTMVKGLVLIVQPSGKKNWQVRYRTAGIRRRMALGGYPALSLADARKRANEVLLQVMDGNDPAAAKKAEHAARLEARLSERDLVKTLVEQFDRRHLASLKSGRQARAFLDRFVVAAWGERDVQTITRRDVIDLIDAIMDSGRGVTANRVLAHGRGFFNWLVARDVIQSSPFVGIKMPAREVSRDRVLSDDEVRWFWQACDRVGEPWGPLGKLLLLTGQRLNEVAGMADGEIDGDVWHLPAERTKNARPHDVPLSGAVKAVLAAKARVDGPAGYVFSTTGRTPVSGFDGARAAIADKMAEIAVEDAQGGPQSSEIPHWTFHDLRRTAATGMARLAIPVRVTESVLNHISGSAAGIVSVYQKYDFAKEKREALEAWARFVEGLTAPDGGKVVALRDRRVGRVRL